MAARICVACGITFPPNHKECEACGAPMKWLGSAEPDTDWELRVELIREASPAKNALRAWRFLRLTLMGFEGASLDLLVATPTVPLHDVEDLLGRGCPHDVATKILL